MCTGIGMCMSKQYTDVNAALCGNAHQVVNEAAAGRIEDVQDPLSQVYENLKVLLQESFSSMCAKTEELEAQKKKDAFLEELMQLCSSRVLKTVCKLSKEGKHMPCPIAIC